MRPRAAGHYQPHPDGFAYAVDLVRGLQSVADFEISVAAYPETHPEAPNAAVRPRQSQGQAAMPAPIAPSRSSSSTPTYSCAFAIAARPPASRASLVPGILPITRFPQMLRFAERCGATVPEWLRQRFDGLEDDADTRRMIAASVAIAQVEALRREGVDEFHFYTLNRADLTYAICHALGVRAQRQHGGGAPAEAALMKVA